MSFVASVIAGIFPYFLCSGTLVLPGHIDLNGLVDLVESERATSFVLPTPWMAALAAELEATPHILESIRTVVHGGSKGDPGLVDRLGKILGDRYIESWGLTENCGVPVAATSPGDFGSSCGARNLFASVGRPVIDTLIRVVDVHGLELPHDGDHVGELMIQSSTMASGYWNDTDATQAAFVDGWFRTGDLGSIDDAGYLYLSDRRTDLIVSGGMNIYPTEIELVLAHCPGVSEVAVIGVPHERWGQTPVAVVVVTPDADLDEHTVIDFCRERLATYKKPTRVYFVAELPRNASGKVLRKELRESFAI